MGSQREILNLSSVGHVGGGGLGGGSGGGGGGNGGNSGGTISGNMDKPNALLLKYSRMCLEQFVSNSKKQLRWCPSVGCDRIIMAGAGISNVRCGPGGCGKSFCFKCGEEAHQPSSCEELMTWIEKCQNESETANWILANTKRCPKCTTRIEKNQVESFDTVSILRGSFEVHFFSLTSMA
jgi:hypothetical protein